MTNAEMMAVLNAQETLLSKKASVHPIVNAKTASNVTQMESALNVKTSE